LTRENERIQWIIIGDGRKKSWVEKQIIERKLTNIFMIGKFPLELMPYFYKEADVLLVSLRNEEIFSLTVPAKIQSYLACGKPILAMINGEGAEIIKESCAGFTVRAGDYRKLAERAIEMSELPKSELIKMAESAKHYYLINFDREKLINFVLAEFGKELNKRNQIFVKG
jgi:glycosyltransferase involved in cell wall biosynthesis